MPFKPGQSGNPGGRPKDKAFRDALSIAVNRADGDATRLAKIAEVLVRKALEGDMAAIREIADRLDGKPAQSVMPDGDGSRVEYVIRWLTEDEAMERAREKTLA